MGTIIESAMHLTGTGEAPEGVTNFQPKTRKKDKTKQAEQKGDIPNTRAHEQTIAIEYIAPESLVKYGRNSRTHSAEQVEQIKKSIQTFGFTNPVIFDENLVLIAGHGRLEAALALKLPAIPGIRLLGLSEAAKKALRIADNKLPLNAGWDEDSLKIELVDLKAEDFSLEVLGFSTDELGYYLDEIDIDGFFAEDEKQEEKQERTRECIKCPHCGEMIEVE